MNLNNSIVKKNEETDFKFIRLPKKVRLLLNGNERSLLGEMVDYQQMIDQYNESKGNDFQMAISYICRNLDISDKTAQSLVNKLVELNLIIKHSGYRTRTKNTYSINTEKIREFEGLTNDQLFELRDKAKKVKKPKPIKTEDPVEVEELNELIEPIQPVDEIQSEIIEQTEQQASELINAKKLIEEFDYFLDEEESRIPISDKALKIMPSKYNAAEKRILIEYIQTDGFQPYGLKEPLLKILAEGI